MKKTALFIASSMLILASCGSTPNVVTVDYSIDYYFESLDGEFIKNNTYTINGNGEVGEKVAAEVKEFPGFKFDGANAKNKLMGKLKETDNVYSIYYLRNSYKISVLGGTSEKSKAKYEEEVKIHPSFAGATPSLNDNSTATLNGEVLKMGYEDVVVTYYLDNEYVLDEETLVKENDYTIYAKINVAEKENTVGIVSSFIDLDENKSPEYFMFGIHNGVAGFYYYNDYSLKLLKENTSSKFNLGEHGFKMSVDKNGNFSCYIDEKQTIVYSLDEFQKAGYEYFPTYGQIGIYSKDKYFDYSNLDCSIGKVSLDEAKKYFADKYSQFNYYKNEFNTITFNNSIGETVVKIKSLPKYEKVALDYENSLNDASSIKEIVSIRKSFAPICLTVQKEYTLDKTYELLEKVHYSIAGHYLEKDSVKIPNTNITLTNNYLDKDERTWIPSAYKLRGSDNEIGLLDQLEIDLEKFNSSEEIYEVPKRYNIDLIRALLQRDLEFFYYQSQSIEGNEMYPNNYFFQNYCGSNGANFKYVGKVYDEYNWDKDYKLCKFFFGSPEDGSPSDILALLSGFDFQVGYQTILNKPYTVYFNTNGGTLGKTVDVYDSQNKHVLPIPTRTGYDFGGWYTSRLFLGPTYTEIPSNNFNDMTFYAKWIQNGEAITLPFEPSALITENMLIQQNKPIKFFGKGVDGTKITVNFDGETKQTIVAQSEWEVTFEARKASYDPKTLVIEGGGISYYFANILVGEVWLCAGQSNMEMLFTWLTGKGAEYIGKYGDFGNLSKIRIFRQFVDDIAEADANNCDQDRWVAPKRIKDIYDKSLISVALACMLEKKLNVPVGVITSARGGTYIEEWLSEETLSKCGSMLTGSDKALESRYYHQLYEELYGVNVSGVVWYQGENNYEQPELYKAQYKELVKQYRTMFNNDSLVVIAQQLVQYGYLDFKDMRLAQWDVANEIENAYCSSAIDSGEKFDIHPAEKIKSTSYIADIALEYVYGIGSDSLSYYPTKASVKDNKIVVEFENKAISCDGEVKYLSVKKSDGSFVSTVGEIIDNQIVIDYIGDAIEVYYAYGDYFGDISLYGANNKPVAPFKVNIDK